MSRYTNTLPARYSHGWARRMRLSAAHLMLAERLRGYMLYSDVYDY